MATAVKAVYKYVVCHVLVSVKTQSDWRRFRLMAFHAKSRIAGIVSSN